MKISLPLSFPTRFNLFLSTIVLLSGLGSAVLLTYHHTEQRFQDLQRQGQILARLMARNLEFPFYVGDRRAARHLLETFRNFPGLLFVRIYDDQCRDWLSVAYRPHPPLRTACPPAHEDILPAQWLWNDAPPPLLLSAPLTTAAASDEANLFFPEDRQTVGRVVVGFDLAGFRRAVYQSTRRVLGFTALMIVPILAFSWWHSRRLTKPLQRLHGALERLTRGRPEPLPISAPIPEIRLLEEKFNTLIGWLENYQKDLEWLAYQDTLTGLHNRAWLQHHLDRLIRETTERNHSLGLLFLDLDRFKIVNDTLGHETGDLLLQTVANLLKRIVREEDAIVRLGGDEFLILLANLSLIHDRAADQASRVAQKIVERLNQPLTIAGHELMATFSIGIALAPHDAQDGETLLRYADTAMYAAKEAGRNTYCLFQPHQSAAGERRLSMEAALRRAVERRQLQFHLQPQIQYPEGNVVGAEVLLRWRWKDAWVSPAEFIPLLEETGLIVEVGEWLITEIIELKRRWHRQALCDAGFCHIGVNVSPVQLWRSNFAQRTLALLQSQDDEVPISLELELTESALVQPTPATLATFARLREAGLRFAIDDFGTGYSNLAYLKRFPLDTIKIDQSFVRDCIDDPADASLVTAICAMARGLGLTVVGEGVENPEQAEFLHRQGCRIMQGYLFARPMPAEAFERFLRDRNQAQKAS